MADTSLRVQGLPPGWTDLYFLVENDAGAVWNGTAFVIYVVANRPLYRLVAVESPAASGRYAVPFPAVPAGTYTWTAFKGPGTSTDPRYAGPQSGYWNGTGFSTGLATPAPTAVQIRQELDANSTRLALLDAAVSTRSTYTGADTPGTATLLSRITLGRAILLDNLDAAVSTRLPTAGYTPPPPGSTPPTVVQIRQELDANSAKLANLDVAVSSRSTYAGIDTPGTSTLLLRLSNARALALDNLNAPITSRLATAAYTAPVTPPTVVQIRQELDTNSTKLARLDAAVSTRSTYAGADSSGVTTLLTRLTPGRATNLDNLAVDVLGGLVSSEIPTTGEIVSALLDAAVVNGTDLRLLLASVAAATCGNIVESADHTTTTITDINDPGGAARLTAVNTPTTRQVSIH